VVNSGSAQRLQATLLLLRGDTERMSGNQ